MVLFSGLAGNGDPRAYRHRHQRGGLFLGRCGGLPGKAASSEKKDPKQRKNSQKGKQLFSGSKTIKNAHGKASFSRIMD
jgi:hypothetical protein